MQDMTNPTSQQKASLIGSELQKAEQACAGVPMKHDGEPEAALWRVLV